jgi:hypothetical protein
VASASRVLATHASLAFLGDLSGGRLAIFRIVHVNQTPLPVFLAVNLSLDAVRRYGRAVLAQGGVKVSVELGPGGVALHIDHHVMRLEVACREHSAHSLLEDILLNGVEAVLFA